MAKRLTSRYTEDETEAFGNTAPVRKGKLAEQLFFDYAVKNFYRVEWHKGIKGKAKNIQGHDFTIWKNENDTFGIDVKANFYQNKNFGIEITENGWLYNPKKNSKLIVHVCPDTKRAISYYRHKMIDYLYVTSNYYEKDGVAYLDSTRPDIKKITKVFSL